MEGNVMTMLQDDVSKYDLSSTGIRFKAGDPLPEELVRKLLIARVSEIESKEKTKQKNP